MDLFIYTLRNVAGAIVTPPLAFLLIILGITLHLKNRKVVTMQKIILGGSVNSSIELTLSQLVLGIIGGSIGSLILTALGVIFNENSGVVYLFILSIILMFIKPRLICFAYSGAILGLLGIMIRFIGIFIPEVSNIVVLDVDILHLLTFIGVFHIIEGLLVMIDGDRGAVPIFTNKDGKILGGYALKRYWLLPIAMMIGIAMNSSSMDYATEFIQNPDWWPLIKSSAGISLITSGIISIFPFYAIVGYSSITFTRSKRGKAISSGCHIFLYGIILVIVAQFARFGILSEVLALICMPLGHEFMLRIQVKNEEKRTPKFMSDEEGLTIIEITTDSKVRGFGVGVEDKLISINNKSVNSEAEMYSIIKESLYNVNLKIKDSKGNVKDIEFRHNRNSRLGLLLVPRNVNKEDIIPVEDNSFESVFSSIKNSDNKEIHKVEKDETDNDENEK